MSILILLVFILNFIFSFLVLWYKFWNVILFLYVINWSRLIKITLVD